MKLLDLFSGIGGFSLAAQWVWGDELEIVAFCEIDPFCQKVLRKHWPNVPIIGDVRDVERETLDNTTGSRHLEQSREIEAEQNSNWKKDRLSLTSGSNGIDLLTGGFPCQPFSCAGKRKGKEDNRFLWPEMFRVIKEIRPRWIIAENVAGIVRMALDDCLSDLEGEGYSTQAIIIPACAVNAPHRRDRVWILAYTGLNAKGTSEESGSTIPTFRSSSEILHSGCGQDVADNSEFIGGSREESKRSGIKTTDSNWWSVEPDVGRVAHGVSNRVDRLKSLGNAIVPQIAIQIFRAIKEIEAWNK